MNDTTKNISTITTAIDDNGLTLAFCDGRTIRVDIHRLDVAIIAQATLHGLKQKLVDAAAISRNTDTGRAASVDDKFNAVDEVFKRLMAGSWNKGRDGGTAVRGGLLFRALCMVYPDKTPEAIRSFLEKKTPKEKTALRNLEKIAAIIATLQADSVDDGMADAMLDELND